MSSDYPDNEPELAMVIVAPNGKIYTLQSSQWSDTKNIVTDPAAQGTVTQLANLGTYLASIPPDYAAGAGVECIVINAKAILGGNSGARAKHAKRKAETRGS